MDGFLIKNIEKNMKKALEIYKDEIIGKIITLYIGKYDSSGNWSKKEDKNKWKVIGINSEYRLLIKRVDSNIKPFSYCSLTDVYRIVKEENNS
jgi:hypothetical protein